MINRKTFSLMLTVVVLGGLILVFGWGIIRKTQLDSSSETLIVDTTTSIFANGDASGFLDRLSDNYLEQRSRDSLATEMRSLSRTMGAFVSIDAIAGATDVPLLPFVQPSPTAFYELDLTLREGVARLTIELEHNQGEWQFSNFFMTADRLMN